MDESAGVDLTALVEPLGEEIPRLLEEHKLPGLAVGVCDASGQHWSAGFGTGRAGHEQPIRTSTMFSVQSASKMYTATAVMLAVQKGLVDLDEPINRYLPEFTVNSRFESTPERKITLRHLLSHTAGFTHEAPLGSNYEVGRGSFEAHCRSISDTWLRFPVGHHADYSNLGIDLAGYILQRRSRLPFHEFVRRELLGPLGLTRTSFDHRTIAREQDRARGHDGGHRRIPFRVPMVAAGGLYTSVDVALRYLQFRLRQGEDLLDSTCISQRIIRELGDRSTDALASPSRPGNVSQEMVDRLVGEYVGGRDAASVVRDGEGLAVVLAGAVYPARVVAQDQIIIEEVSSAGGSHLFTASRRERYRFLPDDDGRPRYMQRMDDGYVRYRNDPFPSDEPTPFDPQWEAGYRITASGATLSRVELRNEDGCPVLESGTAEDLSTLRLGRHRPGLYFCPTGEALDLTRTPPTYANIKLFTVE